MKSRTAFVTRSDQQDTDHKRAFVRYTAAQNPEVAKKMAEAIAADDSLLAGLAPVVKLLMNHATARAILEQVFQRPGVAKKYAKAHQAFSRALAEQLFAPASA
jgi:hypothetical protein